MFGLQINIRVSCNFLCLLLLGVSKHVQSTQNIKFSISLKYFKKVGKDEHVLYGDNHQSFYKLVVSFLVVIARHAQSNRNSKFVISYLWNRSRKKR